MILDAATRLASDLKILTEALEAHRRHRRVEATSLYMRADDFRERMRKTLIEFGDLDDGI